MKFEWNRPGGLPECPYFHWSSITFKRFSIRLHHWHDNDDDRAYHDHGQRFWLIVLRGGYTDIRPAQTGFEDDRGNYSYGVQDVLRRGSIRYRPAEYRHTVQDVIPGTVTLLLMGGPKRRWGFWVNGKRIMRDKYFATMGHHRRGLPPVRIKPDGTRIE